MVLRRIRAPIGCLQKLSSNCDDHMLPVQYFSHSHLAILTTEGDQNKEKEEEGKDKEQVLPFYAASCETDDLRLLVYT